MNIEKEEENCFVVDYDIVKYKDKNFGKDENVKDLEDYEKIIRIYSVIDGSLINYNMRLENEPNLLIEKPMTEGYIAIIKPNPDNPKYDLKHCINEEEYKAIRNLN
ncbi:15342_t:CDS:2 [Entrophospora sp. SA101]|nr:15961_t:CDS:2 [Entrophospora sp. SA101]CAJ0766930.1 15342_t:CDS:2 [Entrophospora sp. SA101]CAJ0850008.1 7923_t:CDS:2 [Entrophospora sp. SA101]CAJ0877490.1 3200_t:CDS:2 [Entrophospora sp. SA101]